ncbi:phage tail assembly chaperone G [Priestia flexa]|uniref:phage tail assembly chaperone G n=1 Tax=Priestia flexa TaxID=86664 RepID=UPI001251A0D7|nr:hypothetical protein FZC66_04435 [Priestia megaterium]
MANLKRNTIELVQNLEEVLEGGEVELKKYWTPPFIPWRVTREATEMLAELQSATGSKKELEMVDKMADFVANRIYQGQFSVDDLYDRLHAPDAAATIYQQIQFITDGQQTDSKNVSPAKKR